MKPKPPPPDLRLPALRRFAAAITILNVVGRLFLGIETSWIQLAAAAMTAYTLETLYEAIDARVKNRKPAFLRRGVVGFIDFLLAGHITAFATSMLLYPGDAVLPVVFATAAGVGSKAIFRAPIGKGERHFLNPSNTGLCVTLLCFPLITAAPPYQFSELVIGKWDWILGGIFICAGTFLNTKFTKKMPLIIAWLSTFMLQATVRHFLFGTRLEASLAPMTGLGFLLYTFYMVSDPATTPVEPRRQVLFGSGVAALYGVIMANHITNALFYSLAAVCTIRGFALHVIDARARARAERSAWAGSPSPEPLQTTPSMSAQNRSAD
jgi:enediyne biosynthesis protein E5